MSPSLGTMIRARRLGWGQSKKHGAFIRMSDAGPGRSLIELCPVNAIPGKKTPHREHCCWWDDPGILDMIPWLRPVRRIKRYIAVVLDDHGAIVESGLSKIGGAT